MRSILVDPLVARLTFHNIGNELMKIVIPIGMKMREQIGEPVVRRNIEQARHEYWSGKHGMVFRAKAGSNLFVHPATV